MLRFLALAIVLALAPAPLSAEDVHQAEFARCSGSNRQTCVVDGDTLWLDGAKIRLTDINTPEVSQPHCASERTLGEAATQRLIALLNAGPFLLERQGSRDADRYGRLLRIASRNGVSLGRMLVDEGLAEEWQGRRGNWCDGTIAAR